MVIEDIVPAIELTDTVAWDFGKDDFELMMKFEPEGCFVAFDDTKFIGLTTTIRFERFGWIGNVIVEAEYRDRGIGSLLMQHSMSYLKDRGVKTIGLYSYVDTIPFYEQLGFHRDKPFIYLSGSGLKRNPGKLVKPMRDEDFQEAIKLDRYCNGFSRVKLLKSLFNTSRNLCYSAFKGDDLVGFVMAKSSYNVAELGPLLCRVDSEDTAAELLDALLTKFIGCEVYIGVPGNKFKIISSLKDLRFKEKFEILRMYYGCKPEDKGCTFAIESLERG